MKLGTHVEEVTQMNVVAILVFGAIGGMIRFVVGQNVCGVLVLNLVGAFALGYLSREIQLHPGIAWLREGIATGLIGSITTFSAFTTDAVQIGSQNVPLSGLYIFVTLVGGVFLSFVGMGFADKVQDLQAIVKVRR